MASYTDYDFKFAKTILSQHFPDLSGRSKRPSPSCLGLWAAASGPRRPKGSSAC